MDTIFFSYSRADSSFVLKLAKDLRDAGVTIWLDQLDIAPGSHWDASIQKALQTSKTLLIILSPTSVASENVMDEVSYALEEGKRVIPILLTSCETPFRLRRLQRLDFTGDYKTGFNGLLDAIGSKEIKNVPVAEPVTQKPPEVKTSPIEPVTKEIKEVSLSQVPKPIIETSKNNSKKYFFIGGGVVILVLIILGITKMGSGSNDEETLVMEESMNRESVNATIPTIDPNIYYTIENISNSHSLGVMKGATDDEAQIVVLSTNGTECQDYQKIELLGQGVYSLIFKHSTKSMTVFTDNSVGQSAIPASGVTIQQFKFVFLNDGYFQIEDPVQPGNVLGLDPASEGFAEGQKVISMRNDGSLQTKWKLISTSEKIQ